MLQKKNIQEPVKLATMLGDHFKQKCTKRTYAAMFNPEGNRILTANCWGTIVWDHQGKKIDTQCPFSGIDATSIKNEDLEQLTLNSAVLSPDGNHILVANDTRVELRDLQGTRLPMLQHPEVSAERALFGPLGNIILTVGKPQKVIIENIYAKTNIAHLWDLSGQLLTELGKGLHGEHVRITKFVVETEGDNVKIAHGGHGFERKKRDILVAKDLLGIGPGTEHSFGGDAGDAVEDLVDDRKTGVAHRDFIHIGKANRHLHIAFGQVFPGLVDLAADVSARPTHAGQKLAIEAPA